MGNLYTQYHKVKSDLSNKQLRAGDLLITHSKLVYVYLGYYSGRYSYMGGYYETGYLYLLINRAMHGRIWEPEEVYEGILNMLNLENFDDTYISFVKNKKKFEHKIRNYDLSPILKNILKVKQYTRISDLKPEDK